EEGGTGEGEPHEQDLGQFLRPGGGTVEHLAGEHLPHGHAYQHGKEDDTDHAEDSGEGGFQSGHGASSPVSAARTASKRSRWKSVVRNSSRRGASASAKACSSTWTNSTPAASARSKAASVWVFHRSVCSVIAASHSSRKSSRSVASMASSRSWRMTM